jgi:hypothetical protein
MTAPYREDGEEARYICIVCYAQTATTAEVCPRCAAPMQPLTDGEIVAELRARAALRKKRIDGRRMRFVIASSLAAAVIVNALLLWFRVYDIEPSHQIQIGSAKAYVAFFFVPLFLFLVISTVLERLTRRMKVFAPARLIDPGKASIPELLSWLAIAPVRTMR